MGRQLMLTIPDEIYHRMEQAAAEYDNDVASVAQRTIMQAFSPFPVHPDRKKMQEEVSAYAAMHSEIRERYLGQYVAIHQGELIDADADPVELHLRISKKLPNEVVLSRQVLQKPERILHIRSPRLEKGL